MTEAMWRSAGTIEVPLHESASEQKAGDNWIVTVFNNDINTYAEVILILMIATQCTEEEAYIEAWEIDNFGKCVVHRSSEAECTRAADIIAQIGIAVEATPDTL